jgi:hypothetical protein
LGGVKAGKEKKNDGLIIFIWVGRETIISPYPLVYYFSSLNFGLPGNLKKIPTTVAAINSNKTFVKITSPPPL